MKTLIISAFPACGKTYLFKEQDKLEFNGIKYSFSDSDSSKFDKQENWEKAYIDSIQSKIGTVDFILISQHDEVLQELNNRHIPFVIVAPSNEEWLNKEEMVLTKQQWFGRFVLRDNSHIKDFNTWLNKLSTNYDNWTTYKSLTRFKPVSVFTLKQNEYLSNIIQELYYKKENITGYSAN